MLRYDRLNSHGVFSVFESDMARIGVDHVLSTMINRAWSIFIRALIMSMTANGFEHTECPMGVEAVLFVVLPRVHSCAHVDLKRGFDLA